MSQNKFATKSTLSIAFDTAAIGFLIIGWLGLPCLSWGQCRSGPAAAHLPEGLTLAINADKVTVRPSEHLVVHIDLSNKSSIVVSMWDYLFVERNYELHVLDSNRKEAPLTSYAKTIRTYPHGSSILVKLASGESDRDEEDLTKLYELSAPEKYTIRVCRDLVDWGNIYSNEIQIEVVP
jgi:hypothetical protein